MFEKFKEKQIAFWGLGRDNQALYNKLSKQLAAGSITVLFDQASEAKNPNLNEAHRVIVGEQINATLQTFDCVILSPGVSIYRNEIQTAIQAGVTVTSATELWFLENFSGKKIIVTGTKGKSTTATLVTKLLQALNQNVALVGNIGNPIWEENNSPDYWVIELSSQQLANFEPESDLALITSLYPEHLDWHGSETNYYSDKLNLLKRSKHSLIDAQTASIIKAEYPESTVDLLDLETQDLRSETIKKLLKTATIAWLGNVHSVQRKNLALALAALLELEFSSELLESALTKLENFSGLPHRQQQLSKTGDHFFIDDSISTIPAATLAAIESCQHTPVTVLIGGFDRGLDYQKFYTELLQSNKLQAVICLPSSGSRIYSELQKILKQTNSGLQLRLAQDLKAAVQIARQITPKNGSILLSPAAPSYDYYKNFQERGLLFAKLAAEV